MIHEIRTYTLVPGKAAEYLRLAGEVGLPVRRDDCASASAPCSWRGPSGRRAT
jgi:hypothetical protein